MLCSATSILLFSLSSHSALWSSLSFSLSVSLHLSLTSSPSHLLSLSPPLFLLSPVSISPHTPTDSIGSVLSLTRDLPFLHFRIQTQTCCASYLSPHTGGPVTLSNSKSFILSCMYFQVVPVFQIGHKSQVAQISPWIVLIARIIHRTQTQHLLLTRLLVC